MECLIWTLNQVYLILQELQEILKKHFFQIWASPVLDNTLTNFKVRELDKISIKPW